MEGKYRKLSERQNRAILEMIKPTNKTLTQVSENSGVTLRTLYSWRKQPEFEEALSKAQSELKERIYSASEADIKIQTLGSLIDTEYKLIDSLDVSEAIINLSKNQERLRVRIKVLEEEVERLKGRV